MVKHILYEEGGPEEQVCGNAEQWSQNANFQ